MWKPESRLIFISPKLDAGGRSILAKVPSGQRQKSRTITLTQFFPRAGAREDANPCDIRDFATLAKLGGDLSQLSRLSQGGGGWKPKNERAAK
jgi:hypothetical protein